MAGLNKVILIGNLGQDPEVRYTQGGTAVSNLRLAVTEKRKRGDKWEDHTEWVTVVCFGRTAESVAQYMEKGRQMYAEGRLQTREYTDRDGKDRRTTEVVADRVLFLGGGGAGRGDDRGRSGGGRSAGGRGRSQGRRGPQEPAGDDFHDDDLPF